MEVLARVAGPIMTLLALSRDLMPRLLRVRPSTEPSIPEEEVEHLLQEGTRAGVAAESE